MVGIGVNLLATWQIAKAQRMSLNVRGSYQHILTDLYAFIGTAIAAAVILVTGFSRADAIASLFICGPVVESRLRPDARCRAGLARGGAGRH